MKQRNLLSKTLTKFLVCTAIVFTLTAPLFYLLTKHFYAEDMIDIMESLEKGMRIPPLDLEHDIMEGMMLQFLLIFLVISISWYITVRFFTRHLLHPFDDTLKKTEQFNLAQGDIPNFKETDIQEFSRLNLSLEKLMRKDKETFRIQKEFTENASHELQTPLAIIRSKLDLLMQEDLDEKQLKLISDLYQLSTRISHLNRNLLLLAKIENVQYSATEMVDITKLLTETLPLYGVLQNGISLKMENHQEHKVSIRANTILLECLLKNLIINAIRHSASGSEVTLLLEDYRFTISNTSADGKSLDTTTLFHRFHSGDGQNKGNGLGLAIIKAICDFHSWTVEYQFKDNKHLFIVDFGQKP